LARSSTNREVSHLLVLVGTVVVIATLYFAKVVLIPFALAILFTFILTPLVRWLEKIRIPRIIAVLLVVTLVMAAIGSIGWVVANQLVDVTNQLPDYTTNIKSKIDFFRKSSPQRLTNATAAVQAISTEIRASATPAPAAPAPKTPSSKLPGASAASPAKPVPVEVIPPAGNFIESLQTFLGPVGTAGIVLVFTIFMLLQREGLRNRFIRLAGSGRLSVMTHAMDEAGDRVSHYLFFQSLVNACYGLLAGIFLYFIHVPNALLWGVIAGLLRFLPYIGPPVGALLPTLFSLAVFNDWTRPLMVLGFFVVLEIAVANFIEPMLYGARTGISSLAILVAAVFWTFLWGPIGLVLSTPLTVCLVVMGRHVPNMQFLNVLLGDEPVLLPSAHFYQRLLAADQVEARQVLNRHLKDKSLEELYDSVVIPALRLAEQDRHRNDLDEESEKFIYQTTKDLVKRLSEEIKDQSGPNRPGEQATTSGPADKPLEPPKRFSSVVCLPARDEADEIIATMLAQLLERAGYNSQCVPLGSVVDMLARVEKVKPDIVCVSALPPFAVTHARNLCERLRSQFPNQGIVVGLWDFSGDKAKAASKIDPTEQIHVFTTLALAIQQVRIMTEIEAGSAGPGIHEPPAPKVAGQ
jgi:predicted PurR-regulated permease PerM